MAENVAMRAVRVNQHSKVSFQLKGESILTTCRPLRQVDTDSLAVGVLTLFQVFPSQNACLQFTSNVRLRISLTEELATSVPCVDVGEVIVLVVN